jgi:hypothetical protein
MDDFIGECIVYSLALFIAVIPFFVKDTTRKWLKFIVCIVVGVLVFFGIRNAWNNYKGRIKAANEANVLRDKVDKLVHNDSVSSNQLEDIKKALNKANIKYDPGTKRVIQSQTNNYFGIMRRKITEKQVIDLIQKATNGKEIDKNTEVIFSVWGSLSEDAEIVSVKKQIIAILKKSGYSNISITTHFADPYVEPEEIKCIYDQQERNLNFVIPFAK